MRGLDTSSYLEMGRMESRAKSWDAAEAAYRAALELCERVYGKGSAESGAVWFGERFPMCQFSVQAGRQAERSSVTQIWLPLSHELQALAIKRPVTDAL
jgi:hypothetical protein